MPFRYISTTNQVPGGLHVSEMDFAMCTQTYTFGCEYGLGCTFYPEDWQCFGSHEYECVSLVSWISVTVFSQPGQYWLLCLLYKLFNFCGLKTLKVGLETTGYKVGLKHSLFHQHENDICVVQWFANVDTVVHKCTASDSSVSWSIESHDRYVHCSSTALGTRSPWTEMTSSTFPFHINK